MKLEHQVTSVEISKKLTILGVLPRGVWCWTKTHQGKWKLALTNSQYEHYYAFTVAELGELLPTIITIEETTYQFYSTKSINGWVVQYKSKTKSLDAFVATTEADARAKLLMYVYSCGLIAEHPENKFLANFAKKLTQ